MTPQLTACFGLDRNGEPMAVIDGLPGEAANMTPGQIDRLLRLLTRIRDDALMNVNGVKHYPEDL